MAQQQSPPTTVRKRTGKFEQFCSDKFTYDLDTDFLDLPSIVRHVKRGKVPEMTTDDVQSLLALCTANLTSLHPDYAVLAGRLEVAAIHRRTVKSFSEFVFKASEENARVFNKDFLLAVRANSTAIDSAIRHSRDFDLNYFSVKVLQQTYLLTRDDVPVERPQFLWMRTAVQLHGADMSAVLETYDLLSRGMYIHATPTLKNSGLAQSQLASCFIQAVDARTTESVFSILQKTANIFMKDGGVGMDCHSVPAKRVDRHPHQPGLLPLMRLVDTTSKYTTSARYARPSAAAVFVAPWHADVFDFIDSRANTGADQLRTRDVFNGLVIPDLFMNRVRDDEQWSLFDPLDVPDLLNCYGTEFEQNYRRYESQGVARLVIPARKVWERIIHQQIETGTPYMLYLDAINRKSNQQNLGVITSGNLCTEIVQFTSATETAVCTLASLILPAFVCDNDTFDFAALHRVTKTVVRNTDRIIDLNYYPTMEARRSAENTRPMGIGVQGLADLFMIMHLPFDSVEARRLNVAISETIYHAAVTASCDLAQQNGLYPSWEGSPASELRLQFDLWERRPSGRYDFEALKSRIHKHGLRNSLLTAQMPTSSTSQISGVNDGVEPFLSNVYVRRGIAAECQVINRWLIRDLMVHGLWTDDMRQRLIRNHGSIQSIPEIPNDVKQVYKTAWELSQRAVIDLAAERGPFICQSQSTSVYIDQPTYKKLTSMHFYGWTSGLKTGMYYLRTRPPMYPIQFALPPSPDLPASDDGHSTDVSSFDNASESSQISEPVAGPADDGDGAATPLVARPATLPLVIELESLTDGQDGHPPTPSVARSMPADCSGCTG